MVSKEQQSRLLALIAGHKTRRGHFTIDDLKEVLAKLGSFGQQDLGLLLSHVQTLADPQTGELEPASFVAWLFADDAAVGDAGAAPEGGRRPPREDRAAAPARSEDENRDEYRTAASIAAALRSRSAVLVDGAYFREAHAAGRRFDPRQVIERDYPHFVVSDVDEDKLFAMRVDALGKCWLMDAPENGVVVAAVSYGWLAPTHPDPEGHHMKMIAGLVAHFEKVISRYKLKLAIFFDYCSLYQKPKTEEQRASFQRTPEQDALFKAGLDNVNLWYAHQMVQVWLLRSVPAASVNPTPYDDRGWTTFEKLISAWVSFLVFDFYELGEEDPSSLPPLVEEEAPSLYCVFSEQLRACRTGTSLHQAPPLQPAVFNAVIAQKRFTNGKTDEAQVVDLYAKTFSEVLHGAKSLCYAGKSWDDAMLAQLADVLPECLVLEDLDLGENPVGDAGVLECIRKSRPLTKLGLGFTGITDASMTSAASAFKGLTHLASCSTKVSDASIAAVSENCPNLQFVALNDTQLSDDSISRLAKGCRSLVHVELDQTLVGDASVACLAQCCPALTELSLRNTRVTDASVCQLVRCAGLSHLKLCNTQVSDSSIELLARHCKGLTFCSLSGTRVTDASVSFMVEALPGLKVLNLGNTQLTDASIAGIAKHCKEITLLNLSSTKATDASVGPIARQCLKLNVLGLEDLQISDLSVCLVAKHLSQITSLDLDHTPVTDASVGHVARDCTNLTRLSLRNTRVTDASIVHVATNLPHLSYIGLDDGQVSEDCLRRLRQRTGLKIVNT